MSETCFKFSLPLLRRSRSIFCILTSSSQSWFERRIFVFHIFCISDDFFIVRGGWVYFVDFAVFLFLWYSIWSKLLMEVLNGSTDPCPEKWTPRFWGECVLQEKVFWLDWRKAYRRSGVCNLSGWCWNGCDRSASWKWYFSRSHRSLPIKWLERVQILSLIQVNPSAFPTPLERRYGVGFFLYSERSVYIYASSRTCFLSWSCFAYFVLSHSTPDRNTWYLSLAFDE